MSFIGVTADIQLLLCSCTAQALAAAIVASDTLVKLVSRQFGAPGRLAIHESLQRLEEDGYLDRLTVAGVAAGPTGAAGVVLNASAGRGSLRRRTVTGVAAAPRIPASLLIDTTSAWL